MRNGTYPAELEQAIADLHEMHKDVCRDAYDWMKDVCNKSEAEALAAALGVAEECRSR